MSKRLILSAITMVVVLSFASLLRSQTTDSNEGKWNNIPPDKRAFAAQKKSSPAPKRDLSGTWDALAEGGIQAKGAYEHPALIAGHPQDEIAGQPDERNIENPLPYTAVGLEALQKHKTSVGVRSLGPSLSNDPVNGCDPPGFPRMQLYDFRDVQITATKNKVLMLQELNANYRIIWTDGRQFPKDPDLRWFGYSIGKWTDDYTFVVETIGLNEKTWLDHAGRPHTSDLKVEEQYHRVDYDTIELTMTITDPKYYSKPWQALNKFVLHRLPDDYDWIEYVCSPSDILDYNDEIGAPVSVPTK